MLGGSFRRCGFWAKGRACCAGIRPVVFFGSSPLFSRSKYGAVSGPRVSSHLSLSHTFRLAWPNRLRLALMLLTARSRTGEQRQGPSILPSLSFSGSHPLGLSSSLLPAPGACPPGSSCRRRQCLFQPPICHAFRILARVRLEEGPQGGQGTDARGRGPREEPLTTAGFGAPSPTWGSRRHAALSPCFRALLHRLGRAGGERPDERLNGHGYGRARSALVGMREDGVGVGARSAPAAAAFSSSLVFFFPHLFLYASCLTSPHALFLPLSSPFFPVRLAGRMPRDEQHASCAHSMGPQMQPLVCHPSSLPRLGGGRQVYTVMRSILPFRCLPSEDGAGRDQLDGAYSWSSPSSSSIHPSVYSALSSVPPGSATTLARSYLLACTRTRTHRRGHSDRAEGARCLDDPFPLSAPLLSCSRFA